jgi:hypothetical protein
MKLFFVVLVSLLMSLSSCSWKFGNPYVAIEQETDSQIFAYTDADVKVTKAGVISDDTTLIIIGVRDNTGADLTSIFNHSMDRIKDIFHERQQVYKEWVK